jgi:hypothetical protein
MGNLTDSRIVNWLLPALLSAGVGALGWLALSVSDLSGSVRELVVQMGDHERRLDNLETLFLRKAGP